MSDFRTSLNIGTSDFKINHEQAILSMGSCFATHMASRLEGLKFNTLLNPYGILFNAVSIAQSLERILENTAFAESELIQHNGLWHSFAHHGHFSGTDKASVLEGINTSLQQANTFLQKTDVLICTLGTAFVFEWKEKTQIVANCHKLPNEQFDRKQLSVDRIIKELSTIFKRLHEKYPHLNIILTLSPVRHIRDGLIENQRSKATLALAIEALEKQEVYVHYFPAYELLLDDLRDYRFYKADMIHPNEIAIDYIWEQFKFVYFDATTTELSVQFHKLAQAVAHKPLHPLSTAHQQFVQKQLQKIAQFEQDYPQLSFEQEKSILNQQLV